MNKEIPEVVVSFVGHEGSFRKDVGKFRVFGDEEPYRFDDIRDNTGRRVERDCER